MPDASLERLRERVRIQGERVSDLRRATDSMQQGQLADRQGRQRFPSIPAAGSPSPE